MKKKISLEQKGKTVDLSQYFGKWVAFVGNLPVASAKDLPLLMETLKKSNLRKEPSIMLIPRKDEGPYILNLFIF